MSEQKKCPFCAEMIQAEAIKCRYCGEMLNDLSPAVTTEKSIESNQHNWIFAGAYAVYNGTAKLPSLGDVEENARVDVVEIDNRNNRWKGALHSLTTKKVFGKSIKLSDKTSYVWFPIGELVIHSEQGTKMGEYEGVVSLDKLGVRTCIIQEWAEGANTNLVFWDKKIRWPLKYVMVFRKKFEPIDSISKEIGRIMYKKTTVMGIQDSTGMRAMAWSVEDLVMEFRNSNSPSLRELPLVLTLKETNIPELNL